MLDTDHILNPDLLLTSVLSGSEDARAEAEGDFRLAFDHAPVGMAIVDGDGRIVHVNAKLCAITGRSESSLTGSLWSSVAGHHENGAGTSRSRAGHLLERRDVRLVLPDGSSVWVAVSGAPMRATGDRPLSMLHVEDITARRHAEEQLRAQALHDGLTGLPNRRLLAARLERALLSTQATDGDVGVLHLDIDRFQAIVDSLGHAAADELLTALAPRLQAVLGPADTLAHFGGDEFVVLCEGLRSTADAVDVALRLLDAVRTPLCVDDTELRLTACVGVALRNDCGPGDLVRDAAAATHRARAAGVVRVAVFDPALRDELTQRLRLELDLHHALRRGELRLDFQPIVTLEETHVVGLEALMRWQHPTRGPIPPDVFIPIAEESDLVLELGRWALSESCQRLAQWVAEYPDRASPSVSVNVSSRQLSEATFVEEVANVVRDARIDPAALVLEVTERTLLASSPIAIAVLEDIRSLGVQIHLDDFGDGYSSLSHLRHLPIDGVKMDRAVVAGLGEGAGGDAVAGAVIELTRALGLTVVAEGVETGLQADRLTAMGCRLAQGYLFGRPASPPALSPLLTRSLPPQGWQPTPARPAGKIAATAPEESALVSLGEVAAALGVSPNTLRRWNAQGRISSERTPGGHRRFRQADVAVLQRDLLGRVVLRRSPVPEGAAPAAAAVLSSDGPAVSQHLGASLYDAGTRGWWAGEEGAGLHGRWLSTLSAACLSGDFDAVLAESRALLRRARLGGASMLECYLALDRTAQIVARRLQQAGVAREETARVMLVLVAVKHGLLDIS